MPHALARKVREQCCLALALACVGGFVDAVGYLTLFHLFTAHMSGNSIALGVHVGEGDWADALHRAFPIPLFVAGVMLGAAVGEALVRAGVRSAFAFTVGLEILLLLAFMAWGHPYYHEGGIRPESAWAFYLLAALPALAMGVQSATLRRVGNVHVRTTYITGMLTNFAEEAVRYLFWLRDRRRQHGVRLGTLLRLSPRQPVFNRMLLMLGLWLCYVAGAVAGACAELSWGPQCLIAPVGVLVLVALVTARHPVPLASQVMEAKLYR